MTPEQIKEIRKLSGRFHGTIEEEIANYHAAKDNDFYKMVAAWQLLALTLDALEACQEEAARVRREALLEAVNKTCWMCAGGWELQDNGDRLYHDIKTNLPDCRATAIHRMIAGQKNEG